MRKKKGFGVLAGLSLFLCLAAVFSVTLAETPSNGHITAAAPRTPPKPASGPYTRIFYYRDGTRARASLFAHPESLDILAPQAYSIDGEGVLLGTVDQGVLDFAALHNIKVMPLITNSNFDKNDGHAFLDDEGKQSMAINSLVVEAHAKHYAGWQIDFEQMDASYRDRFSAFIARLGAALRRQGFIASVAVIAQHSPNPQDYPKNLWQRIVGVYDYAALASSTDFLSVMSYDDPDSKGPVARYSWLQDVVSNSLKSVPPEKLSLGIPLYYWLWNTQTQKLVDVGGYQGILKVLKKYKVKQSYSPVEQAAVITYRRRGKNYALWHENAESIEKKLDLIETNGLHGFSAWALGLESPDIHSIVKR